MEIEFFGANCFRIKTKGATIIIDDNLEKLGGTSPQTDKTVAFYTSDEIKADQKSKSRLVIENPGEFEVGDVTVTGVQTRAHMDEEGVESATVYQFMMANQTVTLLGHVHPDISSEVLELVGGTDVLIVPVGGHGYTLDPAGAAGAVKKVEPDVVIPSHYDMKDLKYEVSASPLEEFTKIMPTSDEGPQDSYKVGKFDSESSQTKVVVLKPQG